MLSPFEELRKELNRVLSLNVKGGPSLLIARRFVEELKMLPVLVPPDAIVSDDK